MIAFIFWLSIFIIAYTYVGYPVLLYLLAKIRKNPVEYQNSEPVVTLLIAAYNEENYIRRKLENSLALDYPAEKLQILVVADGSSDRTAEIVESFQDRHVELCYQPQRQGKLAAIDRAMAFARGDIVLFSDANNTYEPDTVKELVIPFSDPTVGGVSGAKHIIKDDDALGKSEGMYWKYESFIKKQETRLGSCSGVSGEIFAIRRALYEPAPRFIINDDFYLAMRLLGRGYRIVYAPRARSFERVSFSKDDEIIRRKRINAGRYQALRHFRLIFPLNYPRLMWQVISHKVFRLLLPFAMIGAYLANLLALFPQLNGGRPSALWLTFPFNWIFFILQSLFYVLALIGNLSAGKPGKLVYLPTFLVNSNIASFQGFLQFVRGSETALWEKVKRADNGEPING
jgi:poly-beta-1,6-N-acetyl-D-glucosamine synthase